MGIWINQDLCDYVKNQVISLWPEKRVKYSCVPRSWQSSRYIQISTCLRHDMGIHYEVIDNHVQFHIEGIFADDKYRPFLNFICEAITSDDTFKWHRKNGMTQGMCELSQELKDWPDIIDKLKIIITRFDPVIDDYVQKHPELFQIQMAKTIVPKLSYKMSVPSGAVVEKPSIKSVGEISIDKLVIPPYQRPYKWTAKNVNQLISDILTFCSKNKMHYRLGTLVLYNNEIVDGQQRIITLTLILHQMFLK